MKEGYDRLEYLRNAVNDGENAKIMLKVLKKYMDEESEQVLSVIAEETNKEKLADAISDYKAVVRLCKRLEYAISLGTRKEKALEQELHKR